MGCTFHHAHSRSRSLVKHSRAIVAQKLWDRRADLFSWAMMWNAKHYGAQDINPHAIKTVRLCVFDPRGCSKNSALLLLQSDLRSRLKSFSVCASTVKQSAVTLPVKLSVKLPVKQSASVHALRCATSRAAPSFADQPEVPGVWACQVPILHCAGFDKF